jgi:hypothetical protein
MFTKMCGDFCSEVRRRYSTAAYTSKDKVSLSELHLSLDNPITCNPLSHMIFERSFFIGGFDLGMGVIRNH